MTESRATPRVVSLVPSATETLIALGVEPVGCTKFCVVDGIPVVGGTKRVDVDAILDLAPDLVVVNDEENRVQDAEAMRERGIALHSMSPRSVADVGPAVCALAAAVGTAAPVPFADWAAWMDEAATTPRATAFVAVWRRPYMSLAVDTYGSSVLEYVGIKNVFGDASLRYPEVELAEVARRAPDFALLPDEPYAFTAAHVPEVQDALGTATWVELVDGRDLFWWGIRTPVAIARLANQLVEAEAWQK